MLNSAGMRGIKSAILLGVAAVLGYVVFIYLLPTYSPYFSVDSRLKRGEVQQISRRVAQTVGVRLPGSLMENTTFVSNDAALNYLRGKAGPRLTNALVRSDSVPLNYWMIQWFDPKKQSKQSEKFQVRVSQAGKILAFRSYVADSVSGESLDEASAKELLNSSWKKYDLHNLLHTDISRWTIKSSEPVRHENRQDWQFTFVRSGESTFGLNEQVAMRVGHGRIISFDRSYSVPPEFASLYATWSQPFIFMTFFSWIIIFVLFAVGLVVFLKRYNEGEAGIGSALLAGGVYYIAMSAATIISFPSIASYVLIGTLNLFYKSLVVLGALLLLWHPMIGILTSSAWGIGESSARAIWPQKLFTFDAISHFRLFNEKVGVSLLRGFAFGGILLGLYAASHPLFFPNGAIASTATVLDSYVPSISALAGAFAIALFCETIYRFGLLSYFGRKRLVMGVVVSALLFIPSQFYELPYGEYFPVPRILFALGISAAMIYLFLRYDFVTVAVASAIFSLAHMAIPIFNSENSFFEWNAALIVAALLFPLAVSAAALVKKQHFELSVDLMPKHIRRISERERMAKELEIAKSVQTNLLPKTTPSVSQFEFAGLCIPALEVGGDYYDFIQMQEGNVGVAIADVSGKGLPAAIYMTLTKGALQASAENQISPRKVLSKINHIVYRSISRGTFVSMIYAIMDTRSRKVKFARAGHNPLALFSSDDKSAKLFTPNGLALGLDNGDKFDATLEEMEIELKPGDVLIFYTDGFTEAMDSQANEFGEDRLVGLIESNRHLPVDEMLERIEGGVRKFTGNAPQHDDMTMVAIKVKAE